MAWHRGERAVQTRAGVTDRADALLGMQQPEIPPLAQDFLSEQPWIVLGSDDADGRMWASILYGFPGFITATSTTVHIDAEPLPGDPLDNALDGPVGGLALEPSTKRRMRLNGIATTTEGIDIALEQVYSNCPKYIAVRRPIAFEPRQPHKHPGTTLDTRAAELLAAADTAFVATRGPTGYDASHRGGRPGFLNVEDEATLIWPDYQGNNMFNTLGNIAVDPATGLTVVDPHDGTTLYLSGQAEVVWEPQRATKLHIERVVRLEDAAPLRWELIQAARNPQLNSAVS